MPNRIIRESLLDSDRYLGVEEGAQLLFTHLLLLADDFGCLSLAPAFIGRRCFVNRPTDQRLSALIEQLTVADLVRIYEHRGARYGFIPRFRQRLKRETLKNPQPPDELLVDDTDAQEKFRRLNGHTYKGAVVGRAVGSPPSAQCQPTKITHSKENEGIDEKKGGENLNGYEGEVRTARSSDSRNPVDMAAALAEKMRLKDNSQD